MVLPALAFRICSSEGAAENRQRPVGLEPSAGLLSLDHSGGGPAERHLGIAPSFDVARDLTNGPERVLDDVGAGERALELGRQVAAVVNFAPRRIGPFVPEVLTPGFHDADREAVPVGTDRPVPNGAKLLQIVVGPAAFEPPQATPAPTPLKGGGHVGVKAARATI